MSLPWEGFSHRKTRMKPPGKCAVHRMRVSMAGPGDAGSKEVDWCGHRFAIGRRSVAAAVRIDRGSWHSKSVVSGGRLELPGQPWSYPLGIARWCIAGVRRLLQPPSGERRWANYYP